MDALFPPGSSEELNAAAQVPLPKSRSRSPSPSSLRGLVTMMATLLLRVSNIETSFAAAASTPPPAASKAPAAFTPEPIDTNVYEAYPFPPGTPAPPLDKLDGEVPSKVSAWLSTARAWITCYTRLPLSSPACVNYIGTFFLAGRAAQWWQACCAAAANTPLAFSGGFSTFSVL